MARFEKVSRFNDVDLPLPVRKTASSAGYDFVVAEDTTVPAYTDLMFILSRYELLELNDTLLGLEVVLDKDHINSVRLVNLDEATQTMYPLIEPALTDISNQLSAGVALSDIVLSESSKYTQTLLLNHIRDTIAKAKLP